MSTKKEYIPVFIGSTYEDLKEYRKSVQNELVRLQTIVNGMEYFGSTPNTPLDECLSKVRESKVYIGIFAMRYGSIEEKSGKSFTQLEYEEAQRLNLPSLIYIINENNQPILPKYVDTGESAEKLVQFKKELQKKFTISYFTTPDDLSLKIANDLPKILSSLTDQPIDTFEKNDLSGIDLFYKYSKRPLKYYGREIQLSIELKSTYFPLSSNYADAFALKEGSAIFVKGKLVDDIGNIVNSEVSILLDDKVADWFEENNPTGIYCFKVRFLYAKVQTKTIAQNGVFIQPEGQIQLLALEIPKQQNKE